MCFRPSEPSHCLNLRMPAQPVFSSLLRHHDVGNGRPGCAERRVDVLRLPVELQNHTLVGNQKSTRAMKPSASQNSRWSTGRGAPASSSATRPMDSPGDPLAASASSIAVIARCRPWTAFRATTSARMSSRASPRRSAESSAGTDMRRSYEIARSAAVLTRSVSRRPFDTMAVSGSSVGRLAVCGRAPVPATSSVEDRARRRCRGTHRSRAGRAVRPPTRARPRDERRDGRAPP